MTFDAICSDCHYRFSIYLDRAPGCRCQAWRDLPPEHRGCTACGEPTFTYASCAGCPQALAAGSWRDFFEELSR